MPKKGCCRECKYADWDADGCTCMIDGRLVYNASDYICDQYRPAKPLTNADRIRQMTDEELAHEINGIDRRICDKVEICEKDINCYACRLKWLKQEVNEDAGAD